MSKGSVNFVLCVDTEGPLNETALACVTRLNHLFDLSLPLEAETLDKLRQGGFDLPDEVRRQINKVIAPDVRDWLGTWDQVEQNIDDCSTPEYRAQAVDDDGNGIVFNWFVCDWSGDFRVNPRHKPIGINGVFERYWERFHNKADTDPIYFHHHSVPLTKATHHPCRNWTNDTSHITSLVSQMLEFQHFSPCVRTPIMAADISFFCDQYFPFDLSNIALPPSSSDQPDVASRRWVDWEGAPSDWSIYKPDPYDYRISGAGKRWIGRSIQLGSRYGNLDEAEMSKAFERASTGEDVLMSCHIHDHSPMRKYGAFWAMLDKMRTAYPAVHFRNSTAVDAFRRVAGIQDCPAPKLTMTIEGDEVWIDADAPIFGVQPWFGYKTKLGEYGWDNLDVIEPTRWRYTFDALTVPIDFISAVGVACCDASGNTAVVTKELSAA